MKEKVLSYGKKRISCDDLWKLGRFTDYEVFAGVVEDLVAEGILRPVKASGTNGRRPVLYKRYHISVEAVDNEEEIAFARTLNPILNVSGYIKQPGLVNEMRGDLERLSEFFWKHPAKILSPMSVNERSFQIFGREKAIKEESAIKAMLKFNKLDDDRLGIYRTPEPLFDYVCRSQERSIVLILENKDTWFTLRKIARERGLSGWLNYDVLLYGEGKKITDRMGRLADYDQWVLGGKNIYYYFGDLDWEGIRIYKDLVAKNPDLEIRLCVRLYRAMLANGMIQELPLMKAGQKACDFGDFLDGFEDYEKEMILGTLQAGHYIPQEILGYPWFIQQMERIE